MVPWLPACLLLSSVLPAQGDSHTFFQPDRFATLVNPNCSHCVDEAKRRAGELQPTDPVLCWTRGYSDGGAIPLRFFLSPYRVISDSYGVFVYDPDAGFARGFAPSYQFRFHGWRNGILVMKHEDGTLYSALSGIAFAGPRKGDRLSPVATVNSTWGDWMKAYPHAVAYQMVPKYQPVDLPAGNHPDSVKTRGTVDGRLHAEQQVLGLRIGEAAKAYPLASLAKTMLLEDSLDDEPLVLLKDGPIVAAYRPVATQPLKFKGPQPDARGVSPVDKGQPLPPGAPRQAARKLTLTQEGNQIKDRETGSIWDPVGRCQKGELQGWTLEPLDSVVCKWFAWCAEYPDTGVYNNQAKMDPNIKVKEIAGTAEFLRILPKPFGKITAIDPQARKITLILDKENSPKTWPLEADAEIKVSGTWGRLEQFQVDQRVWVWFKLDRKKQPVSIVMLADEASEEEMHGSLSPARKATLKYPAKKIDEMRTLQQKHLESIWDSHGLPGTLAFHHVFSGELEFFLDHEAMRWGRSLKAGDVVFLTAEPPIKAVVKSVTAWRERTAVKLVVGELQASELRVGQRLGMKMNRPRTELLNRPYPLDIGRSEGKAERIDWFLASIYCSCGVSRDICTGHFYTLASCNPNGCGLPRSTREEIGTGIDEGKTDQQIWDDLLKDRGPLMLRPHLFP